MEVQRAPGHTRVPLLFLECPLLAGLGALGQGSGRWAVSAMRDVGASLLPCAVWDAVLGTQGVE